jgi:hypothetical protein
MIVCSMLRKVLTVVSILAFVGQLIVLAVISPSEQTNLNTDNKLTKMVRVYQIVFALLIILIQSYHRKAVMDMEAVYRANLRDQIYHDVLFDVEDGLKEGTLQRLPHRENLQKSRTKIDSSKKNAQQNDLHHYMDISATKIEAKPNPKIDALETKIPQRRQGVMTPSQKTSAKFTQLLAPHYPVVSDAVTWIAVMVSCIFALLTAIPEVIDSYLSAFILYSVTTRILELFAVSLLLAPFTIQNSPLRKRLVAKIKKGSTASQTSHPSRKHFNVPAIGELSPISQVKYDIIKKKTDLEDENIHKDKRFRNDSVYLRSSSKNEGSKNKAWVDRWILNNQPRSSFKESTLENANLPLKRQLSKSSIVSVPAIGDLSPISQKSLSGLTTPTFISLTAKQNQTIDPRSPLKKDHMDMNAVSDHSYHQLSPLNFVAIKEQQQIAHEEQHHSALDEEKDQDYCIKTTRQELAENSEQEEKFSKVESMSPQSLLDSGVSRSQAKYDKNGKNDNNVEINNEHSISTFDQRRRKLEALFTA